MKGKGTKCVFIPPLPSLLRKGGALGCETLLHQNRVLSVAFVEYGVIAWRPLIMVDWEMRCPANLLFRQLVRVETIRL